MGSTVVDCGHCDGEGVCKRGEGKNSCRKCQDELGYSIALRRQVTCSVCKGKGKVVLDG